MERLSTYTSTVLDHLLPPEVAEKTKHHVLDTMAVMVSGPRLKPGEMATRFVCFQGGMPDVLGEDRARSLVRAVWELDGSALVRELRPLLQM
jgi:2-methylcitrate dehydratase PrpD